jgi:hypothetical protein
MNIAFGKEGKKKTKLKVGHWCVSSIAWRNGMQAGNEQKRESVPELFING